MATRIMVVDDEPAIGKLLMYQLTGFGYQVTYFQDGLEALQRLPATRPDLVLLDVMMPLMSGWEVCREIRACSAVPIIMLTAKGADGDIVTGLGAGADDYVTKPFSMTQLHARIEAVLRRSSHSPSLRPLARPAARVDAHLHDSDGQKMKNTVSFVARAAPAANVETSLSAVEEASLPPIASDSDVRPLRLGQHIREARAARGMTLHQIERAIQVRWEFLQAIEQENWSYMPRAQLRHALNAYGEYLGLDLPAMLRPPKPQRQEPFLPLQFAALFAVVVVVLVVGMYLL
jgi:DNA-binding response OmpR family regulator